MKAAPHRARWWPWLLLALGLALTGFFVVRAWHQWTYLERLESGELQVQTLRGWMTLPYIEKVYGVPEARVRAALALPAQGFEERSLREWWDAAGIDAQVGRRTVEALILQQRSPVTAPGTAPGTPP